MELLLPGTDRGVALEAAIAAVVLLVAMVLVRRDRDLRVFVAGLGVLTAAWFGVRALH